MTSSYVYRTPQLRPLGSAAPETRNTADRAGVAAAPLPKPPQTQTAASLSHVARLPQREHLDARRDATPEAVSTPARPHEAGEEDAATEETSVAAPHDAATMPIPRGQSMGDRMIQRCDPLRTLLIDNALIHFTPTEYRLLIPILDHISRPVPFKDLAHSVLNRDLDRDGRRLLDKHIDHIRSKLRPVGLNIHCVARYGYMLLPEE